MDIPSEARLGLVMPALADKIRQLAVMLDSEKIWIRVTEGLRSWTYQQTLYQKGRYLIPSTDEWKVGEKAKIVTNCPGGHSYHNFGMGVDVVPGAVISPGGVFVADWNLSHPSWQRIVELGLGLGLDSGAKWRTFKDYPHLQLTGRFPEGAPNDEVRQIFKDGGMEAVWQEAFR